MQTSHPINEAENTPKAMKNGAHILYMYNELEKYIEIAYEYIYMGLLNDSIVLFMESEEIITTIKTRLQHSDLQDFHNRVNNFIYINANEFYVVNKKLNAEKLIKLLQPFLKKGASIRTWGNVPLPSNEAMLENIRQYECDCDHFIMNEKVIFVCTYNALITLSYIQNELLKTHTHIMEATEKVNYLVNR